MASKICRAVLWVFGIAYVAALALFAIGLFGLFGQERDPLSAVFLIPLGLPWNLYVEGATEELRPWLAAAAPLANLVILLLFCRLFSGRR